MSREAKTGRVRRGRVAVVAGVAIALGVGLVSSMAGAANVPAEPVHHDINQYVLFAETQMNFKGAQTNQATQADGRGVVHGDVGVNHVWGNQPGWAMGICSNGRLKMDDGSQVNADSVHGDGGMCDFYDVNTNNLSGQPAINPRHGMGSLPDQNWNGNLLVQTLPPVLTPVCNKALPLTVAPGATAAPPAGVYGDFRAGDNSTVNLGAGVYTFCNWSTGKGVTVSDTATTSIQIVSSFSTNDRLTLGTPAAQCNGTSQVPVFVGGANVGPSEPAVTFGRGSTINGNFWVPTGRINLGDTTNLYGHFWADQISSDANVNATGCNPPPPTNTSTSTSTSTSSTSTSIATTPTTFGGET